MTLDIGVAHISPQIRNPGCWLAQFLPVKEDICVIELGKVLLWIGGLILLFGVVLILAGKMNLPIGRLPGDLTWRRKNTTVYFPLMTSILLSVVLSLVLYFVNRMGR